MSKKGHVPTRTCIGCRRKRNKEEMIRMIRSPEGVVVNGLKLHHGRGYYLCPDPRCLTLVKSKKRGFEFLETVDLRYPSAGDFFKEAKGLR